MRSNGILYAGFFIWTAIHNHYSIPANILFSFIVISPFFAFQAYGWMSFCPGRPWCAEKIPFIYGFVQEHYWNNGFLRYWTAQQIPNFILAAPIIFVSIAALYYYISMNRIPFFTLGFGKDTSKLTSEYAALKLLPYVYLTLFLLLYVVLFSHVQIILRFFTSVPLLYWFLGHMMNKKVQGMARFYIYYTVIYSCIGAALFGVFLPPA